MREMQGTMSLIYVTKLEEDRKTMQYPTKVQMFVSTLWNICRLLAILWLCVAALTIVSRACDQKSQEVPQLSAAARLPVGKAAGPIGPVRPKPLQIQDPLPF